MYLENMYFNSCKFTKSQRNKIELYLNSIYEVFGCGIDEYNVTPYIKVKVYIMKVHDVKIHISSSISNIPYMCVIPTHNIRLTICSNKKMMYIINKIINSKSDLQLISQLFKNKD